MKRKVNIERILLIAIFLFTMAEMAMIAFDIKANKVRPIEERKGFYVEEELPDFKAMKLEEVTFDE